MKSLVVDDSRLWSKQIERYLVDLGDVDVSSSGRSAFEKFLQSHHDNCPYDFISLDMNMPNWDGVQALEAMRSYEIVLKKPFTEVVVVSAKLTPDLVKTFFTAGCSHCLEKPLDDLKLKSILNKIQNN